MPGRCPTHYVLRWMTPATLLGQKLECIGDERASACSIDFRAACISLGLVYRREGDVTTQWRKHLKIRNAIGPHCACTVRVSLTQIKPPLTQRDKRRIITILDQNLAPINPLLRRQTAPNKLVPPLLGILRLGLQSRLPLLLLLLLLSHLRRRQPQAPNHHDDDDTQGDNDPPRHHPPQAFNLGPRVRLQIDGDFVVELVDLTFHFALLVADGHLAVVEHALQLVLHRPAFLSQPLAEDVDFVLQMGAFRAHLLLFGFAPRRHFGPELGAGRAEEVGLVLHHAFAHERFPRQVHVVGHHEPDGFHNGDGLGVVPAGVDEAVDEPVGVEVVDVAWGVYWLPAIKSRRGLLGSLLLFLVLCGVRYAVEHAFHVLFLDVLCCLGRLLLGCWLSLIRCRICLHRPGKATIDCDFYHPLGEVVARWLGHSAVGFAPLAKGTGDVEQPWLPRRNAGPPAPPSHLATASLLAAGTHISPISTMDLEFIVIGHRLFNLHSRKRSSMEQVVFGNDLLVDQRIQRPY
ncbi:hypothetical protein KC367_g135 [Hortaea werneckii]|nr:hypothetical protein KC367_g135 [Hortaea werneckii]